MDFTCIETVLGLPEFRVTAQVLGPRHLDWHRERRDTSIGCPHCQTCCWQGKERRTRCIRDLPLLERPTVLWLPLRRFACRGCQHRPWETRATFGKRVKWTARLYPQVRQDVLQGCPCRELARRYGLSDRTVCRWTLARSRGGRPRKLGRALGMDEDARRQGHRSTTLLVDWDQGKPLMTFKGRRADDIVEWFRSRPPEELARVDVVVVERSKTYASAIKERCGESVHVIDRLHGAHLAVNALDEVWRAVQKQREPEDAKAPKKLRRRWLTSANQRNGDALMARDEWRRRFPQRREMIDWVQDVRKWFERPEDKPARQALLKLIERARKSAQEPLKRMAGTLTRWCEPIVHDIRHRSSNGMTEGLHNKIKLIQRMAYGLRHEHNRRKRILAWCGAP